MLPIVIFNTMSVLDSTTEESEFEMDPLDYQKEDLLDDVRFKLSTLNPITYSLVISMRIQRFNICISCRK